MDDRKIEIPTECNQLFIRRFTTFNFRMAFLVFAQAPNHKEYQTCVYANDKERVQILVNELTHWYFAKRIDDNSVMYEREPR